MKKKRNGWRWLFLLLPLLSIQCAVSLVKQAETFKKNQYYDEALNCYMKALKRGPDRVDLKISIDRLLKEASQYYCLSAKEEIASGNTAEAARLYQKALDFDPGNNEAKRALTDLTTTKSDISALEKIRKEMELNIGLPEIFRKKTKFDLILKGKKDLKVVFESLANSGNVNFIFDPGFRDRKVEVSMIDVTFHEALENLCTIFSCRYFVLDPHNIVITAGDRASADTYEKLLVKNIFFSNIDAAEARQTIDSLIKMERAVVNKGSNSLMVADRPENIVLIEKIAQFIDKRRGEVEIEVEVIEVDQNKLDEYGMQLSPYRVGMSLDGSDKGKRLNDFYYMGSDDLLFSVPKVVWNFFSSITDSQVLARPRLRGMDEQKIEIKLGDKVPIPRTTFVPSSGGGVSDLPITSFDMHEVGMTVTVTPHIHSNREVSLELRFEMTYIVKPGTTYVPPTLGNRVVMSTLRLHDSETGIIAGLIRGSSKGISEGIPIINKIPILKEIFSSRNRTSDRTDIVFSITPRILRMPEVTREDLEAYLIGTRQQVRMEKWKDYKGEDKPEESKKK